MDEEHKTQEPPQMVTVEWDDGPISIVIKHGWQDRVRPDQLLTQVVEQVQPHLEPTGHSWRSQLSLKNVTLEELPEFNALIREARREQHQEPKPQMQVVHSGHLAAGWIQGYLHHIKGPSDWIKTASLQGIADELMHVITPPPRETSTPTTARDRIVRFMRKN